MDISRRTFLAASTTVGIGAIGWLAGCATPESNSLLGSLQARIKGQVLIPPDEGFRAASEPSNGRYRSVVPLAVAVVADELDVVECINWCQDNGVQPVARGGGHSYAGFSTTNGLVINLSRLNDVTVDRGAATLRVGGGTLNQDLTGVLNDGPLFLPVGTCVSIGLGGLALGGGIGFTSHWAGLTCDQLTGTQMVDAAGQLLTADDTSNRDLFWACKGSAGGSLGINTHFEFSLVEIPPTVVYFEFSFVGSQAAFDVLRGFDDLMANAPAELNAVCMAQSVPPQERATKGASVTAMVRGQFVGVESDARDVLSPLARIGGLRSEVVEQLPFWRAHAKLSTPTPEPHSFSEPNRYTRERLPDALLTQLVDALQDCPSQSGEATGSIWLFGWVGGPVIGKVAPKGTAYVHRDVSLILRATVVWPNDAPTGVSDDLLAWSEAVMVLARPHTLNQSYQNFPDRSMTDYLQRYYGANLARLVRVKAKYDPGNLFRNAQSIPVALT